MNPATRRCFCWLSRSPKYGYGLLRARLTAGEERQQHYFVQTIEAGRVYLLSLLEKHKGVVREFRVDLGHANVPPSCDCDECLHGGATAKTKKVCGRLAVFMAMKAGGKLPDSPQE